MTILLGNGDGTFSEASGSPLLETYFPGAIVPVDLNSDGLTDLTITMKFRTTSPSCWQKAQARSSTPSFNVGTAPTAMVTGHFRTPGTTIDLAITNFFDDTVTVLLEMATGHSLQLLEVHLRRALVHSRSSPPTSMEMGIPTSQSRTRITQ